MMLGDEVNSAAIKVTVQAVEVTADLIKGIIAEINKRKAQGPKLKEGEQTLKELNKHNESLDLMPFSSEDIKSIRRDLKEYGIDFAVIKTAENNYDLYFKGKDIKQVNAALEHYGASKAFTKTSIKDRIQKAVQKARDINDSMKKALQKLRTRGQEAR